MHGEKHANRIFFRKKLSEAAFRGFSKYGRFALLIFFREFLDVSLFRAVLFFVAPVFVTDRFFVSWIIFLSYFYIFYLVFLFMYVPERRFELLRLCGRWHLKCAHPAPCALQRIRTSTGLLPHVPETCACTNFARRAEMGECIVCWHIHPP